MAITNFPGFNEYQHLWNQVIYHIRISVYMTRTFQRDINNSNNSSSGGSYSSNHLSSSPHIQPSGCYLVFILFDSVFFFWFALPSDWKWRLLSILDLLSGKPGAADALERRQSCSFPYSYEGLMVILLVYFTVDLIILDHEGSCFLLLRSSPSSLLTFVLYTGHIRLLLSKWAQYGLWLGIPAMLFLKWRCQYVP